MTNSESRQPWRELLTDARFAPSPHNIQPWRVEAMSATEAVLHYVPDRLIPTTDTVGEFTVIAFGIFLEYLRILASHRGQALHWQALRDDIDYGVSGPTPLFALTLTDGAGPDRLTPDLIRTRRTSRLPYAGESRVRVACLEHLQATAAEFGHTFVWSQDAAMVDWVLQLNRDTLFLDMDDDGARTEVGHWLRFSARAARARRDGLAATCMCLPGWLLRLVFRHHGLLKVFPIRQIVRWYYLRTMLGTTTVAWISGPTGNLAEWVEAGRLVGRLWLVMTRFGVYLHPFGSVITNPIAHARLDEKLNHADGDPPCWLLVRLGHSDDPPTSERRRVDEILYEAPL